MKILRLTIFLTGKKWNIKCKKRFNQKVECIDVEKNGNKKNLKHHKTQRQKLNESCQNHQGPASHSSKCEFRSIFLGKNKSFDEGKSKNSA